MEIGINVSNLTWIRGRFGISDSRGEDGGFGVSERERESAYQLASTLTW